MVDSAISIDEAYLVSSPKMEQAVHYSNGEEWNITALDTFDKRAWRKHVGASMHSRQEWVTQTACTRSLSGNAADLLCTHVPLPGILKCHFCTGIGGGSCSSWVNCSAVHSSCTRL